MREDDDEEDDYDAEDEDMDDYEPAFILEVLDTSARRRIRDVGLGQAFDFKDRELLSVTFSEESFAENYAGPEHEELVEHSSYQALKEEDDEEDETCELTDCLKLFNMEEQLGPDDAWYCNKCKDHVQATKKFDLWKLPPILVIHLKGLNLSEYTLSEAELPCYDLFAVSNHFGALGGGHYTAFAKNPNDNKWYKFDDSNVSPMNEDRVCSSAAYVLFYRRRDVNEIKQELKYAPPVVTQEEEGDNSEEDEEEAEDFDVDTKPEDSVDEEEPLNNDALACIPTLESYDIAGDNFPGEPESTPMEDIDPSPVAPEA